MDSKKIITLEDVLNSKTYVKPNGGLDYKTPLDYLQPFLDIVSPYATKWSVSTSDTVTNKNDDGSENTAYARVAVEAIMPEQYTGLEHDTRIGLVYALDIAKPYLKVYTGKNAWACTNLSIFNADHIYTGELTAGWRLVYDKVKSYIKSLDPDFEDWLEKVNTLQNLQYSESGVDEKIGEMLRKSIKNNFSTAIVKTVRELNNPKSIYAMKGGHTTGWNILSAITQYVTDSIDISERPDKTLFAHELFAPELEHLN